jgi:Protein of unknown function (DUF3179)
VFSRLVDGQAYTFGVSGKLWKNGLVMYDHQTETLWSGVTGEALQGPLTGKRLQIRTAVPKVRWRDWRAAYPHSQVFTSHGVQARSEDVYASYHASGRTGLFPPEHANAQLRPKDLVMGIRIGEQARAYPLRIFTRSKIITDRVAGTDLVVYRDPESEASAVFERQVEGQVLSFFPGPMWTLLQDTNTGSTWDIVTGTAVAGLLTGKRLHRVPHHNSYWFAWVDFYPHTTLFQAP